MTRPIRVAQVVTASMGVRALLLDHLERLRALGYEVDAVSAEDRDVADLHKRGIQVLTVPMAREPSPSADVRTLSALVKLFRERRYDVVHSHTPKAGLLAPVAARLARTPLILHTIHGLLFHDRSPPGLALLGAACEYWTGAWAHRLLSQSREDVDTATRVHICSPDRIFYLGNGIDVRRFSPDSVAGARQRLRAELGFGDGDVVVGMVGRLVREKGFEEFFDAMRRIMQRRPNAKVVVVGPLEPDQSDRLEPERLLEGLDPSRARFLGRRDDLPEIYSALDIFALPSHREGIPRTVMEASAMALPVVTTRIRGCREVVDDGKTGLLVEPRAAAELEGAILRLVDDETERRRFGAAGRRRVCEHFDAELVLDRLGQFYEQHAGKPQGVRRESPHATHH